MMTTTAVVVISIIAVVVVYALWVGIPMWMIHSRPDTPPDVALPPYLAGHEDELREELDRELTHSGR